MTMLRSTFSRLVLSCVLVAGIVAAPGARTIEVEGQHRSDAIAITRVTLGSQEVQCGLVASPTALQPVQPVDSGDDWLQNLTLYAKNRTDKVIDFVQFTLVFPETGDGSRQSPTRMYPLTLGRIPDAVAFSAKSGQPLHQNPAMQPLAWAPGQTLAIPLAKYAEAIRSNIERGASPSSITRLTIRRSSVVFNDGMRWDGDYYTPDVDHPGQYTKLGPRFFPGTPTWPPQ